MKTLKNKQQGFTIIEVMIVLVIAAVILLIVFLAVPALQRNSRNTQRKNDVANLVAAVAEYASNNQGKLPTTQTVFDDEVLTNVKLGYYQSDEVFWNDASSPVTAGVVNDDAVGVYMGQNSNCDGNTRINGSSRQYAAVYNLESSSGLNQAQCQAG